MKEESYKLKSNTMIELYRGNSEITFENINDSDLNQDTNLESISDEEKKLVEEDVFNIAKLAGDNINKVVFPKGINIDSSRALKELYTSNIVFDGSSEIFDKMKENKIENIDGNVIDLIKEQHITKDKELSEYVIFCGIKNLCRAGDIFSLNFSSAKEYECCCKYIPNDYEYEISIRVNTVDEFKLLDELKNNGKDSKNMYLSIDKSVLDHVDNVDEKYRVDCIIENMSELSIDELNELKEKCDIKDICILSEQKSIGREKNFLKYYDKSGYYKNIGYYDVDIYSQLRKCVDKYIQGIDNDMPDIEKFITIYKRMANEIEYDREDLIYIESDGVEGKKNKNAHNIKGALLENLSVCEGISKSLEQVLSCVGIKAPNVYGELVDKEKKDGHAWNIVEIDGDMYNTDLTWDLDYIKKCTNPMYCLQSDREFLHDDYKVKYDNLKIENSYDQDKLSEMFFENEKFKIDEKGELYSSKDMKELINNLTENYNSDGVEIEITGINRIIIFNIIDGKKIPSIYHKTPIGDPVYDSENISTMKGDTQEILKFVKEYIADSEFIEKDRGQRGVITIKRQDGIRLSIDNDAKELLKEIESNKKIDFIEDKAEEKIVEEQEIIKNEVEEETAMTEYKESFFRKILNNSRKIYNKIKEKIFKRNDKESEQEENITVEENKLPSWDLRNWKEKEIQYAAQQAKENKNRENKIENERE